LCLLPRLQRRLCLLQRHLLILKLLILKLLILKL
jgi:hypothetical protein